MITSATSSTSFAIARNTRSATRELPMPLVERIAVTVLRVVRV